MPVQARINKEPSRREEMDELAAEDSKATSQKTGATTVEDSDDLLDEIDSVLEENAYEFIKGYVQKGGEAVAVFLDTVTRGFTTMFPPRGLHHG